MSERVFDWSDDARVVVLPLDHPSPDIGGALSYCVERAIEIADGDPGPHHVEIVHGSPGPIQMDEIRRLRADPSFPSF